MKFMVISDIHGSTYFLNIALEVFKKEQADNLIILGDFLNHAPRNALPKEYGPMNVVDLLNNVKDKVIAIKGNCDSEIDELLLKFPFMPMAMLISGDKKFIFTHGHIYNEDNLPAMNKGDYLIHGHFHIPWVKNIDGRIVASPGSIAIPRGNSTYSYMIIEDGTIDIKELLTEKSILEEVKVGE